MDLPNLLAGLVLLAFFFGVFFFAKSLRRLENAIKRLEEGAVVVADNLASSIDRADSADDTVPGASADAALRTGDA